MQSWQPAILAPSHEHADLRRRVVRDRVQRYRDAILYVHDETVRGMNAGNDVFTLMDTITLPPELDVGEGYGAVAWTVRGIYEGYLGWFDENPATMYAVSPQADLSRARGAARRTRTPIRRARRGARRRGPPRRGPAAHRRRPRERSRRTGRRSRPGSRRSRRCSPRARNINELGWLNGARRALEAQLAN